MKLTLNQAQIKGNRPLLLQHFSTLQKYCRGLPYRIYFGSPLARLHVLGYGLSVHQPSRGLLALVSPPLMSSRHHNLEPYGRWHATIFISLAKIMPTTPDQI